MSDFTLSLTINADGKLAVREIQNTTAAQKANEDQAKRSNQTTRQSTTELDRYMASLRKEADTLGMTKSQIRLYEAARLGATQADLRAIAVTNQLIEAQQRSAAGAGGLGRAIGAIGGAAALAAIAKHYAVASDNATLLAARIGLVVSSMQNQQRVQRELFATAQQLQLPYTELANQFPRIARAVQGYGGSVRDATEITKIFAQTVRISGASQQEATSSAIQFAQALQSGRLQGDELRSILENNGLLAEYLAKGLGVTVGELRKMGEEGKLTSEKVVRALLAQQTAIDEAAGKIPKTIQGSFQALTNQMDQAVTSSSTFNGVMRDSIAVVELMAAAVKKLKELGAIELPVGPYYQRAMAERAQQAIDARGSTRGGAGSQLVRSFRQSEINTTNYETGDFNTARDNAARQIRELLKETDTATGINMRYSASIEDMTSKWVNAAAKGQLTEQEIKDLSAAIQLEGVKRQEAIDRLAKRGHASLESEVELIRRRADLQIAGGETYVKVQEDNLKRALELEEYYHQIGLTSERDYINAKANLQAEGARRVISQLQSELASEERVLGALQSRKGVSPTDAAKHEADIEQQKKKVLKVQTDLEVATKSLGDVERRRGQDTVKAERAIAEAVRATERAQEDYERSLEEEVEELERRVDLMGMSEQQQARANAQLDALNKHLRREAELQRELYDLRQKNPSATQQIEALEKALASLQAKGVPMIMRIGDAVERELNLKYTMQAWQEFSQLGGQVIADLAMDWENRHETMRRVSEQFWRQMLSLWSQKLILQFGANLIGGPVGAALAAQAGGIGQGTLAGAAIDGISNWASTGISMYRGGASLYSSMFGQSAGAGTLYPNAAAELAAINGVPTAAAGGGALGGAAMTGYGAILLGMMLSNDYFKQGWRMDNQDGLARAQSIPINATDRFFRGLGMSDRVAAILSGSSTQARLWGHGPTHADAYGVRGTLTGTGITGQTWQDYSRRGGTFRSDERWQEDGALSPQQQRWLNGMFGSISQVTGGLASRLGVDRGAALSGYSHSFDMQLSNNGEPLSEEEMAKLMGDLMGEVLRDQVARILRAGGNTGLADYVQSLKGSGEEIGRTVQAIIGLLDTVHSLDLAIAQMSGDSTAVLKETLKELERNVTDAKAAMTAALASGDPEQILAAEKELEAAVMNRYQTEIQMVEQLRDAISNLKEEAYQFSISIAGRINAVGGSRDIGGIALNRAMDLRGGIGGTANVPGQMRDLNRYVNAIDTWYNARRSEIERQMAAEQQALQAIASAQQAAAQARIAQLQGELALAKQYQEIVDRTREMIDDMRLSSANPMSAQGRTTLAGEDLRALVDKYRAATGAGRVEIANQVLQAISTYRALGQEAYQRPSPEWQAIYNEIMRDLTDVQGDAKTFAERSVEIEAAILQVQQQSAGFQASIAAAAAAGNSQLEALNAEALDYYLWAEQEGQRLFTMQEAAYQAQLNAITGGMDVELYIAQLQREARDELVKIRELIAAFLAAVGAGSGTTGTGTTGTSTSTSSGSTVNGPTTNVQAKLMLNEVVLGEVIAPIVDKRIGVSLTRIKRGVDNS